MPPPNRPIADAAGANKPGQQKNGSVPLRRRKEAAKRSWSGEELGDSFEGMRRRQKIWRRQIIRLTERLELLRIEYERYFMGLTKREPLRDRMELEKSVRETRIPVGAPASLRFRAENLFARLNLLRAFWDRSLRQLEEGTYRRHRVRPAAPPPLPPLPDLDDDEDDDEEFAEGPDTTLEAPVAPEPGRAPAPRQVEVAEKAAPSPQFVMADPAAEPAKPSTPPRPEAPPQPAPPPRPSSPPQPSAPPRPAAPPQPSPPPRPAAPPQPAAHAGAAAASGQGVRYRALYNQYVAAQREVGVSSAPPSYEVFSRSLDRQREAQRRHHGAADVDFHVKMAGGKVKVVAKLKKKKA